VSQMQALSRNGVQRVHVGDTFEDIDELEDLKALFERTSKLSTEERQLRSISRTYCFLKNMYSTTTAINDDEKTRGVILE